MKNISRLPKDEGKDFNEPKNNYNHFGLFSTITITRAEILVGLFSAFLAGLFIGGILVSTFLRHSGWN